MVPPQYVVAIAILPPIGTKQEKVSFRSLKKVQIFIQHCTKDNYCDLVCL